MNKVTKANILALAGILAVAPAIGLARPALDNPVKDAATLQLEVHKALNTLAYYSIFDNLTYSVEDGRVTLSGQVSRPVIRNSAVNVVKRIPGVTGVDDQIEVLPLSNYDDRLRISAFYAIYGTPALSRYAINARPPIHIIVRNGNVTLEGVVNNELDRKIAYNQVAGLPGVFSVTNNLRLDSAD